MRSFPYRTALGWTYDSGDFERCLDPALELLARRPGALPGRGVGVDCAAQPPSGAAGLVGLAAAGASAATCSWAWVWRSASSVQAASTSTPTVRREDDKFVVRSARPRPARATRRCSRRSPATGSGWIGTVRVRTGDTDALADGLGSFASALDRRWAAPRWRRPPTTCSRAGRATRASRPSRSSRGRVRRHWSRSPAPTGIVRVRRLIAVDDAGRIVNPLLAEGQVIGGAVQGLGAVLSESRSYSPAGVPLSSLLDYALLTAAELPEFSTAFVETPSPLNPLGAKGVGESGTIGAPAGGGQRARGRARRRRLDPPFTAEKVWRALR